MSDALMCCNLFKTQYLIYLIWLFERRTALFSVLPPSRTFSQVYSRGNLAIKTQLSIARAGLVTVRYCLLMGFKPPADVDASQRQVYSESRWWPEAFGRPLRQQAA